MLRSHGRRTLHNVCSCRTTHIVNTRPSTYCTISLIRPWAIYAKKGTPVDQIRFRSTSNIDISDTSPTEVDIGAEITGVPKSSWQRLKLIKCLTAFSTREEVRTLAAENGIDPLLFNSTYLSFRDFILTSKTLPADLHIVLNDLMQETGHIDDLFPFFVNYARETNPFLDSKEEIKKLSDLRNPASWYPQARKLRRQIYYHVGPTNSGKTYNALKRFYESKTGVYCGPLRLLAQEVFQKTNKQGTKCDLLTGDDKRTMNVDGSPADHVACTVEMTQLTKHYEVAVIDEIQMVRDQQRGHAFTRAFLGLCADEIHVCGEAAALELINELAADCGDDVVITQYNRLTDLTALSYAIDDFSKIQKGDCIVCFSKKHIYEISRQLEIKGIPTAIIYGSLPASTKLAQAAMFNDPEHATKVLVATDAVGLGLNLSIQRMILYSIDRTQKLAVPTQKQSRKPTESVAANDEEELNGEEVLSDEEGLNGEEDLSGGVLGGEGGEAETTVQYQYVTEEIPAYQALQIAGRAGRFGTMFENGYTTTFHLKDLVRYRNLLNSPIERIKKAGLGPTMEQIQMFSFYLPKASILEIVEKFEEITQLDNDKYFLCDTSNQKSIAEAIEDIPLPLRARYLYMLSPCDTTKAFHKVMIQMFAREHSSGRPLTFDFLCRAIDWPCKEPKTIADLLHLEVVFEVTDLYMWLSYRFPEILPHEGHVRLLQRELDLLIRDGITRINTLVRQSDKVLLDDHLDKGISGEQKSSGSNVDHTSVIDNNSIADTGLETGHESDRTLSSEKKPLGIHRKTTTEVPIPSYKPRRGRSFDELYLKNHTK